MNCRNKGHAYGLIDEVGISSTIAGLLKGDKVDRIELDAAISVRKFQDLWHHSYDLRDEPLVEVADLVEVKALIIPC